MTALGASPAEPLPAIPSLTYGVGDVHGRIDLLQKMLAAIAKDAAEAAPEQTPIVVILGDVIDRGPKSRDCIDRLIGLEGEAWIEPKFIYGNHEHAFLQFLDDPSTGAGWLRHGGGTTLSSYGVGLPRFTHDVDAWTATMDELAAVVPVEHLAFLKAMKLWYEAGDYLFVHAGVRPGVPLDEQEDEDLLSIRDEFLKSENSCDKVVVHGHTPLSQPRFRRWRISLDTGAYASGVLSGVRLLGESQTLIQVRA